MGLGWETPVDVRLEALGGTISRRFPGEKGQGTGARTQSNAERGRNP